MFNEINDGSLNSLLVRRLGMVQASASPAVAPEIFPTLALEVDRPEWGYLKGERRGAAIIGVGAAAANYSMAQLYLPAGAGQLCVIEKVQVVGTGQVVMSRAAVIGAIVAGWSPFAVKVNLDTRYAFANRPTTVIETNQSASTPTGTLFARLNTGDVYDSPIIIAPGQAIVIWTSALNSLLQANVTWRERPAQPGELV